MEDIYANIFIIKCSRETEKVGYLGGGRAEALDWDGGAWFGFQVAPFWKPRRFHHGLCCPALAL